MSHIIAVDHGFGYIKTPNTCMLTGVTASNVEPFTLQNTVLLGGDSILPPERQQAIREGGEAYVSELLNKLKTGGFDYETTYTVFLGGGARIVQRFAPKLADAAFLTDVCVNAKGYETIARQMKKHAKQG